LAGDEIDVLTLENGDPRSADSAETLEGSNKVAETDGVVGRQIQKAQPHPGWPSVFTEDALADPTHLRADVDRFIVAR
jgi:hypothetical protein